MRSPETRAKMSASLRAVGHRPKVQGGNGRALTEPQRLLSEALGWPTEFVVRTGAGGSAAGLSTHYKIDIANPETKVAIEVDGPSHDNPKARARDEKKAAFLRSQGWRVLRFSNAAVMERLEECCRTAASTTSR